MTAPSAQTLENVRLSELATQRRAQEVAEAKAFKAEQEAAIYQEWLAGQPARDAELKQKQDLAARATEAARRAQRIAITSTLRNDYPGMSTARRTAINTAVLEEPTLNYIFSGQGGVGKSTMLDVLARLAAVSGKQALVTNGMEWESDVRANAFSNFEDKQALDISAEGLDRCRPVFLGFDEVDKMTRSEFLLNHFHALIDSVIKRHHQIVLTTNLSKEQFKTLLGESIWWRLMQNPEPNGRGGLGCAWVEFGDKQ